jgi:hypothetical protein
LSQIVFKEQIIFDPQHGIVKREVHFGIIKLKVKSLVSDVMLLFSDFREKLLTGYVFFQKQVSPADPRTLKAERDKYLAIH